MIGKKPRTVEEQEAAGVKDFFDQLLPGAIRFYPDSCVCGNTWRSVWAVKEYPPSTEEQALLARLGSHEGVTLRIYTGRWKRRSSGPSSRRPPGGTSCCGAGTTCRKPSGRRETFRMWRSC